MAISPYNSDYVFCVGNVLVSGVCEAGISHTANGGTTWEHDEIAQGTNARAIAFDPSDHNRVYVGGDVNWGDPLLLISPDLGLTWTSSSAGLAGVVNALATDPNHSGVIYCGTSSGVYKSNDNGQIWASTGLTQYIRTLVIDPGSDVVYAGTYSAGVYRTIDAGVTWSDDNLGLTNLRTLSLALSSGASPALFAGTDGSGVFGPPSSPPPFSGWSREPDLLLGPRSKRVNNGGCLTYSSDVYALKGNSTYEFYCYDISENSWTTEAVIPALGASGRPKKVAKGASLAATGGSIYATKGNRTTDFYQFDPGNNAWFTKAAVPLDGQALNAGTGAAAVEILSVPYVYLLKGSSTCAFYRYNTVTNIWETMADAPLGASGRTFTDGSAIAYDPDHNVIYALKGNRNEFYAYDVGADQWTTKTALPIAGASGNKKAKAGAGLAVLNGYVYVQKGNRTLDLWRYDPAHDAWAQLDNMPVGGGKKITSGGALTAGDGKVYAVKGDYTLEFYSYTPATFGCAQPPMHSDEQSARSNPVSDLSLRITPNPISTGTTISYSLPKPGDVSLKLYDMTGKLVTTLATGGQTAGTHSLSFRAQRGNLVNGIYILKLESDNTTASQKLILQ